MDAHLSSERVTVVGAGIAGAACALALRAAGVDVVVRERAPTPGGRMAAPVLHGRRVDVGAAYFTVADDSFAGVVSGWQERELVRAWSDTLDVIGGDSTPGPMRWSAPDGLASLVRDLLAGVDVSFCDAVESVPGRPVAFAAPDPQVARVVGPLPGFAWVDYDPAIAVVAGWESRRWTMPNAAFVNDDPDIALIVDDGARRGDGAPVLVVYSTPSLARRHLAAPQDAVPTVLKALRRTLGVSLTPAWTRVQRWTFAKPAGTHGAASYALTADLVGVCGDSWCPSGSPRVESAWLSGHRLGTELAGQIDH